MSSDPAAPEREGREHIPLHIRITHQTKALEQERPPCERCGKAPRARTLTICDPCWQDWAEEEIARNPYGDPYV